MQCIELITYRNVRKAVRKTMLDAAVKLAAQADDEWEKHPENAVRMYNAACDLIRSRVTSIMVEYEKPNSHESEA